MLILRQSTAIDIRMGPFVDATDGVTPETGVTIAAADQAEVLKENGAATVAMAGTFAAVTGCDGWYDYTVASGDVDTVGEVVFVMQDSSVFLPVFVRAMVVEEAVYDEIYDATAALNVGLAAGAITNASLAGNMEIVFETDFATNYNATRNAWATNVQDFVGTSAADPFNGQVVAASVTGAVGSVTAGVTLANGAVSDASLAGGLETVFETDFATNYNATRNAWATNVQDTVGTGNLPADAVTISGDATTADNLQVLFDGNEGFYAAYSGPRGPGVYLNDAAANTSTTNGVDGTVGNPVSTIAAAVTIAGSLVLNRIYITNDSAITLGATMNDYEFVGLGSNDNNSIALNSIDVDQSAFYNLTISGIQGGSARVKYEDCIVGTATLHCYALRCGFTDSVTGVTFSNNDDNILDSCFSMVAGNATPIFICSGANLDVSFRHYSGGIEISTSSATATLSIESMGQVIFTADCNVSTAVSMRGLQTITDNTAGMSALTEGARIDRDAINAEVVDALATDTYAEPGQEAPGATVSLSTKISYLYKAWRNRSTQDATTYTLYADDTTTADQTATVSDNGTTADKGEVGSGP